MGFCISDGNGQAVIYARRRSRRKLRRAYLDLSIKNQQQEQGKLRSSSVTVDYFLGLQFC